MPPDIAILVSSFERPWHLERCLASIEAQRQVAGRFEVVVTDDGSRDRTLPMVASLIRRVSFPLDYTTHLHNGFQLARCRNEGVAASTAPYLLFVDGDCILRAITCACTWKSGALGASSEAIACGLIKKRRNGLISISSAKTRTSTWRQSPRRAASAGKRSGQSSTKGAVCQCARD